MQKKCILECKWSNDFCYTIYFSFNIIGNDVLDKDSRLGTLEIALIVAVPICVACVFAVIGYAFWQTKYKQRRYQVDCENSLESCEPMLPPDHSIKDMIDMTTSGSGSGMGMFIIITLES